MLYVVCAHCMWCACEIWVHSVCAQGGMHTHVKCACMWGICMHMRCVHVSCVCDVYYVISMCAVWQGLNGGCAGWICCVCVCVWWVWMVTVQCVCVCAYCCMYTLSLLGGSYYCVSLRAATDTKGPWIVKDVGDALDAQGCAGDCSHACVQSRGAACIWNPSCPPLSAPPRPRWADDWCSSVASETASWRGGAGGSSKCARTPAVWTLHGWGTFMLTYPHHQSAGNWGLKSWNELLKVENNQLVFQTRFLEGLNLCLGPNIPLLKSGTPIATLPCGCHSAAWRVCQPWLWSRALLPPHCLSPATRKTVLAARGQEVMKDEAHAPSTELSLWRLWGTHECHTMGAVPVSTSMGLSGYS